MKAYCAITGKLVARTAIHIGSGEGGDTTDALCRRDAEGRWLIPGTAIGGALRAIATRHAPRLRGVEICKGMREDNDGKPCGCAVCHLFGEFNPGEENAEESGGRASRLLIANARAHLPSDKSARIRDGVGIERASRTAARAGRVKFDLEVLPAGTEFDLRLELEDTSPQDERLLAVALAEWQAGRAWLGGRVARGLGAFELCQVKFVHRELKSLDDLVAFLQTDQPWQPQTTNDATEDAKWLATRLSEVTKELAEETDWSEGVARSFVTINFDLRFDGLFLTNDTIAAARSGFDHAPLLDVMTKQGRPLLAGASLRGVLRTQAERIARTMATLEAAEEADLQKRLRIFLVICPACNPVEANADAPLASCDRLLTKAGVKGDEEVREEQLCLACCLFGSTRRGSRLIIEDAEEARPFEQSSKVLDFLAIDRFTGGGKDGAKFDAVASWQPSFAVRLHLENPQAWELGWLALVLRDVRDGMVTFGFGAAKGFGQAKLTSYRLDYGFISEGDFHGPADLARAQKADDQSIYRLLSWNTSDAGQAAELRGLEKTWLEQFHEERRKVERVGREQAKEERRLPEIEADTFFGTAAETLYGKARTL